MGIEIMNLKNSFLNHDYGIRIDRKTKWGNPYKMESEADRLKVIKKYTYYILESDLLNSIHELEDKWLYCWCYPKPCHGEVLKYLCEHPEVIEMLRGGILTKDDIIKKIWDANGWKQEITGHQMTLF
jgi:hypothetical protein